MAKEDYKELINYVANRTGVSKHRTWKVLKEYSYVLKDQVKKGNKISIEPLLTITFTTGQGLIYENKEVNLQDQIELVSENLGIPFLDVKNLIVTYVQRIYDRIQEGYQVNIKGISYLIPSKDKEGNIVCVPRVSPSMEKPDEADFVLSTSEGHIILKSLTGDDLRFRIDISDNLEIPYKLATKDRKIELKEIKI